jgi:N-acyl homoserine lactone hydrolase
MRTLFLTALLLVVVGPVAAQTVERLYLMDCGHNAAKDQARWSPGVNVGKPIEMSDTCVLLKHREQWLLWDTGYPDAVADQPVDTPVGHATRARKLMSQLGELNLKPSDVAFVAISHTHADHVGNVDVFPDSTLLTPPTFTSDPIIAALKLALTSDGKANMATASRRCI